MKKLTKEQIIMLHSELIRETGGSDGLRDEGLLDFPSLQQKGARLGYGLICNHAFIDGNKRIGAHIMLLFLSLNGIELAYTQDELSNMVLDVASGKLQFEDMVKWIIKHQN